MKNIQNLRELLINPRSENIDRARSELIFNIMLLGFMALTLFAFIISLARYINNTNTAEQVSPYVSGSMLLIIAALYVHSRIHFKKYLIIIFLGMYFAIATMALYKFGYVLTPGILIYVLVIVVSGILISSLASLFVTTISILNLCVLQYLQTNGIVKANTNGTGVELSSADLTIYIAIFSIILLVSWLSNKEINNSLRRARVSEVLLKEERDNLEAIVKMRTHELERAHAESTVELYRFAEFGHLNSSLVHDLANPLTAVSINFNELAHKTGETELVSQINQGLDSMRGYVESTRNQLQSRSINKEFNSAKEIKIIISDQKPKIKAHKINCSVNLDNNLIINGDKIKFNQLLLNLICNALDSLAESKKNKKHIKVVSKLYRKDRLIITITDNGPGIPKDKLKSIFNSFYTTKANGNGTGIGLTIVNRMINDFGGKISVQSTSRLTEFKVILPLSQEQALFDSQVDA